MTQATDIQWFHSIDFGNGTVTAGRRPAADLKETADVVFRDRVAGLSVLDVGAWDGYFSSAGNDVLPWQGTRGRPIELVGTQPCVRD